MCRTHAHSDLAFLRFVSCIGCRDRWGCRACTCHFGHWCVELGSIQGRYSSLFYGGKVGFKTWPGEREDGRYHQAFQQQGGGPFTSYGTLNSLLEISTVSMRLICMCAWTLLLRVMRLSSLRRPEIHLWSAAIDQKSSL